MRIVGLFVALCWHYASAAAEPGGIALAEPFFKGHVPFASTMAGAAIAAYSYLGFDAVSTLTEETIDPKKNMPRAILWIALIGGAIFVLAAYTMQLAHPGVEFKDSDSAAFEVAKMIGGDIFVTVFLAGLILAQFASGISAQASVSSGLKCRIKPGQLDAGIVGGELPVDFGLKLISPSLPCSHLAAHGVDVVDAPV